MKSFEMKSFEMPSSRAGGFEDQALHATSQGALGLKGPDRVDETSDRCE